MTSDPTREALLAEFDGSVCPACHHRAHDPGGCSECPRCELHTDEAAAFVLRYEPELIAALATASTPPLDDHHPQCGKPGGGFCTCHVEEGAPFGSLEGTDHCWVCGSSRKAHEAALDRLGRSTP